MVLERAIAAVLLLTPLVADPAWADVLEVAPNGEAQWLSGPNLVAPQQSELATIGAEGSFISSSSAGSAAAYSAADRVRPVAGIPLRYVAAVIRLADRYDLSPALIEALVWQESRWRENAVSPAGARGLTQLMPGTARELGVNADDPFANLEGGVRYFREQLDRFNGDLGRALAAYNAGPGRVVQAGGIPRIRETQNYVAAIIGRLSRHRGTLQ